MNKNINLNLNGEQPEKHILVILPIPRDKIAIKNIDTEINNHISLHYLEDENFKYDAICMDFNVSAYVNRAIDYVIQNKIDGLIYSHDMASLIAALVCEKTGLIGPSLDSVFLACHKYYSRQIEQSPVACEVLNIHDYDLENMQINYPCYVKAPCLMCSHLHFIVNDKDEMEKTLAIMREELPRWGKMFFDFFELFISKENYPFAHQQVVIVEELVVDYSQCAVEGWVDSQGKVHIWAISDINYDGNKQRSQNCYSMPTFVSSSVQAEIIELTTHTVLNHRIRSGFFNVDIWHWHGKKPSKIIEVNGRAASLYHLMHKQCFNADLYAAMLFLCLGNDLSCLLESPMAKEHNKKTQTVGALFFVVTFGKGQATEFMDFKNVETMMVSDDIYGMELFVQPESLIRDNGTAGFRMAKFYVFGSSYREINDIANKWRALIVKNIPLSPYAINRLGVDKAFNNFSIPEVVLTHARCLQPTKIQQQPYLANSHDPNMPVFLPEPNEKDLLVLEYQNLNDSFNISNWVKANISSLLETLKENPAILLRNFKIHSTEDFNTFCNATDLSLMTYAGGNAARKQVHSSVFTASDDPPEFAIAPHNEMSYSENYPKIIMFYCDSEPATGGETPIGCVYKVTQLLDPNVKEKFRKLGIKYMRHLPDKNSGLLFNWQNSFFTEDINEVNKLLTDFGYNYSWDSNKALTYTYNMPAFIIHPRSKQEIWFNQVTSHASWTESHPSYAKYRLPYEKAPNHCFYGNGEEIEPEVLAHVRSCMWKACVAFSWRKGDILILDNLSVMHARLPYSGPRKILASLMNE